MFDYDVDSAVYWSRSYQQLAQAARETSDPHYRAVFAGRAGQSLRRARAAARAYNTRSAS